MNNNHAQSVVSVISREKTVPQLPTIYHEPGKLPEVLDAIEDAIAEMADEANIYIWGGSLFRIYRLKEPDEGHIKRPAGAVLLHRVDAAHLAEIATMAASHFRYDKRSDGWRPMDCPRRAADAVLSRGHWPKLSPLHGVVEAPTLTTKGYLVDGAGYHHSGLFLACVPPGYTRPPVAPTQADAQAAIGRLQEAIATFPFVSDADHVAGVAAVMTALVRRSLPSAPMVAITAPTPGTGKSLLAEVVAAISLGRQAAMLALGDDEAETEKRLYSALLAGDSLLIADNIETQLKGALLCQILTAPSVQFRPLGASVMATVPTHTTLIATGNNLSIIGDLRRRVMLIRLDAATERPEQRIFNRDALAYVSYKRGELIRDALTVSLAYIAAGSPIIDGLAPYGGFSDWDRLVRRPLVWAGMPDPLTPADVLRETDPDLETTRSMFSAWHMTFSDKAVTVAEAIARARASIPRLDGGSDPHHPELRDAIQAAAGDKLDSRRLGFWLRKHRDRIVDSLQLRQAEADSHAKVARWRVVSAG
jgi:putative DNA primase/helicase